MTFSTAFDFFLFTALVVANDFNGTIDNHIREGALAPEAKYLYQASLRHIETGKHFCSGSVIHSSWILTAAHCIYSNNTSTVFVVVGTHSLTTEGFGFFVSKIIIHEGFNSTSFINDIALLQLAGVINFSSRVQAIALARFATPGGINCVLSGWGLAAFNYFSADLQHVSLKTLSLSQCKEALPDFPIFKTHVCTYVNEDYGACRGDSGGPLVADGAQIGIISWGVPCAINKPYVFTSVVAYKMWIRNKTLS